jgi:hypothetical protein
MSATMLPQSLSNMQKELLKLYAAEVPESHLLTIKDMIARYLWEQAQQEADRVWLEKGYNQDTLNGWLNKDNG